MKGKNKSGFYSSVRKFLQRKNIVISARRYGIDALGAMAQGLFCSLLIGTIISTIGQQFNVPILEKVGGFGKSMAGAAMAIAIGQALQAPPLVLFSLAAVGHAANDCGGAGGRHESFYRLGYGLRGLPQAGKCDPPDVAGGDCIAVPDDGLQRFAPLLRDYG